MGKKRAAVIGSPEEDQIKADKATKLSQKKLREGKTAKAPGLKGGQRVVDTADESIAAYEQVEAKLVAANSTPTPAEPAPDTTKAASKIHVRSKTYKASKSQVNPENLYSLTDGINLLRKVSTAKFDPTIELHIILRSSPTGKITVSLPHAFGKSRRVAIATDEVISQIEKGKIEFDVLVAAPSQMGKLVKLAKVLGPRGLMPNPKNGTVSDNPESTAKKLESDKSTTLKLDKSGPVIHTSIGKLSFKDKQLEENISAVLGTVSGYLKKVVLKSTMSPAIKLQV